MYGGKNQTFRNYKRKVGDLTSRMILDLFKTTFYQLCIIINTNRIIKYAFITK